MILDSIVLENFGAYGDRQEAILTPEDGKPIVLFGGMNGGGKTTILDAIQLAFYGSEAKLSNRGRLGYREYLRDCMHRGAERGARSGISLRFRRQMNGRECSFELERTWRRGAKGIEERLRVFQDGLVDDALAENWSETIEAYLPNGIAHLFFFDGEQVKDLAEGGNASAILGTALHSLLGLDMVDRLESDLKVYERRKRDETVLPHVDLGLDRARASLEALLAAQASAAVREGELSNEVSQHQKGLKAAEDGFRSEGGDLYLRAQEVQQTLEASISEKRSLESQLRALADGPLPLSLIGARISNVDTQSRRESEIRQAKVLLGALEARDAGLMSELQRHKVPTVTLVKLRQFLDADRTGRSELAAEQVVLDAPEDLPPRLAHLQSVVLPSALEQASRLVAELSDVDERILRLQTQLECTPTDAQIASAHSRLYAARDNLKSRMADLDAVRAELQSSIRQIEQLEATVEKLSNGALESQIDVDDLKRTLKHSEKARKTLRSFKERVVMRNIARVERLMFDAFRKLLRKDDLVTALTIDPVTYEPQLRGNDGRPLPIDRLSAGERQLLATAMLWGLAQASGRPVPTIIDTPLGRLDSTHRKHLAERYFVNASSQVVLLSTDEEIVGDYHETLKPFVARSYLLAHEATSGSTTIKQGYFAQ